MPRRMIALFLALIITSTLALAPMRAYAAPPTGNLNVPITGTFTDAVGGVGNFVGNLQVTRFANQGGQLVAIGQLTGTLTDSLGNVLPVTSDVNLPVTDTSGTCDILHLDLGPLNLDLLGLEVHLNQVILDIVAQAGAGNLLGNLLCAVTHLLDGNASLNAIAALLNNILRALG
jgi:hypothetical protein